MSEQDYSVGRRVYNGASNAPTRGTVDPMGYIDRSLNNPSQKRSGLAQAALRRIGGTQGQPQPQTQQPQMQQPQVQPPVGAPSPVGASPMMQPLPGPPSPLIMDPTGKISASASMFPGSTGGMNDNAF